MNRLFSFTLICCTLMAMLCGSVIAIAKATVLPNTSLIPEFAMCGQTPCYLGITPDKTLFREAASIIAHAQEDAVELAPGSFDLPRLRTHLFVGSTGEVIDEMDISFSPGNAIRAGEIIRRFGAPCYAASLGSTLAIKYPHLAVFFAMDKSGAFGILRPGSRVIQIRLLGGASKDCLPVDNKTIFGWRGFSGY